MQELNQFCTNFRKDFYPTQQDPNKPVSFWTEKELLHREIVDAFVIILRTQGCSWGVHSGCTMCGYHADSMLTTVTDKQLLAQIDHALTNYTNQPVVKIFTSGSFFDTREISMHIQKKIFEKLREKPVQKISVESRPEYITDHTLSHAKDNLQQTSLEIGIGLETAHDLIREYTINKGFTFSAYLHATELMKKYNVQTKTYLLIKPPFVTEWEALNDTLQSIQKIAETTDTISLNPTNIQRFTVVEFLWRRKHYRPPWLWSIISILHQGKKLFPGILKCDITGGGTPRGAHNCGTCDHRILTAISAFSLNQNTDIFNDLSCDCQTLWQDQLDVEAFSFQSYPDFSEETPYAYRC
ncbi:MAG: archaeosine biosynthesis radical SAM protein RaSEA [Candidatus Thermoplasmatota archaeon]